MRIEKEYIRYFIIFFTVSLIILIGGIVFFCYETYNLYKAYRLSKSEISEVAIITKINTPPTGLTHPVYFQLKNDDKKYRINLLLLLAGRPKVGDMINVVFNEKKDFYIVKEFTKALYGAYTVGIAIAILLLCISILFFRSLKYFKGAPGDRGSGYISPASGGDIFCPETD
jgi:hypothetical protein